MRTSTTDPRRFVDSPQLPGSSLVRRALVTVTLCATGLMIFWIVVSLLSHGHLQHVDDGLVRWLHKTSNPSVPIGPDWFNGAMRDITALGSNTILAIITIGAAALLLLMDRIGPAILLTTSMVGAAILNSILKVAFDRARPPYISSSVNVETASFPSSHAMLSTVLYILLAAIAAREFADRRVGTALLSMGAGIAIAVGASRIYLGAHWPSDVLAGWLLGALVTLAAWHLSSTPRPPQSKA
ncbi:MAG: phosphatase PAP2 family protein [Hyphomicrobiaceae bacterium]